MKAMPKLMLALLLLISTVGFGQSAGPDQTVCAGSTVYMAATGSGYWSALSGNPSATVIDSVTSGNTGVSGFTSGGTYGFVWSASHNCVNIVTGPTNTVNADIISSSPTITNRSGEYFQAEHWTYGGRPGESRDLMRFNLSSIPAGSIITSAVLNLYADTNSTNGAISGTANATNLLRVTSPWADSTVTWNTQPSTTTTDEIYLHQAANKYQNYTNLDISSFVQYWVNNPSQNYGIMSKMVSSMVYNHLILCSNHNPNASLRPTLQICYSTPAFDTVYIHVVQGAAPTLSQTDSCLGADTLRATVPAYAASGNIYWWSGSVLESSSTSSHTTFVPVNAGTYTAVVSDSSGCMSLPSNAVVVSSCVPDTGTAGPDQTVCQGTTVTMAATGTGYWSALPANPGTAVIDSPYNANATVSGFSTNGLYGFVWATGHQCVDIITGPSNATNADFISSSANLNNRAKEYFQAEAWTYGGNAGESRDLMRFDLSSIPAGSIVTSATLDLYGDTSSANGVSQGTANAAYLQLVTSAWADSTVTWNTQPTTTTAGEVYLHQALNKYQNYTNLDITSFAQVWVSNPSQNHGLESRLVYPHAYNHLALCSPNNPDSTLRPALHICYSTPVFDTMYINVLSNATPSLYQTDSCLGLDTLMAALMNPDTLYWWNGSLLVGTSAANNNFVPTTAGTYTVTTHGANGCTSLHSNPVTVNNCAMDTVWPGDADRNRIVDNLDLLTIGLGYNYSGPGRTVQGNVWQADAATDWGQFFSIYTPLVDYVNADCDGNGLIDANDTVAIVTNFGLTHAKNNSYSTPTRSGLPLLNVSFTADTLLNNDTLIANITLGDSALQASNIYGLAFTFNYDPIVIDSNTSSFVFTNSFMTPSSINLNKNFRTEGTVKAAITGIDHLGRSGYGQIATFIAVITTGNVNGKDLSYYKNLCYITDITAIDPDGYKIAVNAGIDSNYIGYYPNGIRDIAPEATVNLYPNPAAHIVKITSDAAISSVVITDMIGQNAMTKSINNKTSENIDISSLTSGVYTVRVSTTQGSVTSKLVVRR